ncbi:MAG: Na(+)/H(+) antiporter subunit D, partial [Gemmatimonadaceae bacterium]|nr:Na(+)/H(+) antiporter subunit D [Gemmatimonadaceae bacterium]
MLEHLPPGSLLVLGALVVPFLRGVPRQGWLLALPVLSFAHLLSLDHGSYGHVPLFDMTLTVTRVDKLSLVWGYIFHIAAFLSALYANHVKDELQQVAALIYAGSAIA